jgi:hypothetical protein
MTYQGRILSDDNCALSSLGIDRDATFHVRGRLLGGAPGDDDEKTPSPTASSSSSMDQTPTHGLLIIDGSPPVTLLAKGIVRFDKFFIQYEHRQNDSSLVLFVSEGCVSSSVGLFFHQHQASKASQIAEVKQAITKSQADLRLAEEKGH